LARDVNLTDKQKGVVRGVIPAAVLSAVGLCGAPLLLPLSALPADEPGARIAWGVQWALLPVLTLMVSVARVGNHRFYTPEDIDGSGLTSGTPQIQVLRAVLQNTLEQTVLAVTAYSIWAVVMPRSWLWSISMAALFFVAGRILFARGYTHGASGRALGFGLTAYPTFGMLATLAVVLAIRLVMK
jgi:MAPEG family